MPIFDDTRDDWKARSPRGRITTVSPSRRVGCMWHWNGPAMRLAGRPHSACLAAVLADQRFHQGTRGWSDVGYTGLICPHGRAIEGRGVDTVGAHCAGYNTDWYGFQFMLGEGETVTAAQWARAAELIRDVTARSGHALRHLPHSAGFATSCPGPEITARVKSGAIAKASTPTDPVATPEETDMSMTDKVVPSPMLANEEFVSPIRALDLVMRWSLEARDNAIQGRKIAEAQALKGAALTPDEVKAAVKEALSEAAQIDVVVRPEVTQ